MYGVVSGTRSKYASIASLRVLFVVVSLEIVFLLAILFLSMHGGGLTFSEALAAQSRGSLASSIPPLSLFFLLYVLFEAKRAPFDHSEAESELVAGHMVEFGGRSLLFFYICEYVHFFAALFLVIILRVGVPGLSASAPMVSFIENLLTVIL